jgi:hypothetical protein
MWEPMLQQYTKTFRGVQISIWFVTFGSFVLTHKAFVAAAFFGMMQVGAVVGTLLGLRLKARPGAPSAPRT